MTKLHARHVRVSAAVCAAFLLAASVANTDLDAAAPSARQNPSAEPPQEDAEYSAALKEVSALFSNAEKEYRRGDVPAAAQLYDKALIALEKATNNVTRRRYAPAYFRYGMLLEAQHRFDAAVAAVERGLRLAPRDVEGQIYLGSLLAKAGHTDRALAHYRSQLDSSIPVAEERAVINLKVEHLGGHAEASTRAPNLTSAALFQGVSIGIVPINERQDDIPLGDLCLILEGSWRVRCSVLAPVRIPDALILDAARDQYNAHVMLDEIDRRFAGSAARPSHILAITGRDIFTPRSNFVFSLQRGTKAGGVAVLSTIRFTSDIPEFYEPQFVAARRVAIQALSTTGSMFGFERPTDPQCPLAYPESLEEFQLKRLRLCASEEQQRDELLRQKGGNGSPFGQPLADQIRQAFLKYGIE